MSTQPKALELADFLAGLRSPRCGESAAELRRLQGEVESMRAERIATEKRVSVLHAAFEASEASDAESLRLYRAARERADKLSELNAQMLDALEKVLPMAKESVTHPELSIEILDAISAIRAAKGQS